MRKITLLLFAICIALPALAQEDKWEKWGPTSPSQAGFLVRVGYTIGGTTPLPLPNEIRSINEFSPKGGATIGLDVYKMYSRRWGLMAGWHFYYQGFHTGADVKNYKMSLTQEGNTMSGYFTGRDITNTDMWGVLMPVMFTLRMSSRWNLSVGPYLSLFFKKHFKGEVYDNKDGIGYLRVDDPTGEKINIDRENPATYNFSDDMRNWNGGMEFAFDFKATRHLNLFGTLDWGLSSIWSKDFEAVDFKMYPIYATVGVAYRY